MSNDYAVETRLSVSNFKFTVLAQPGRGPFRRTHQVNHPTLTYLPAPGGNPSSGCLGDPHSHQSFRRFGNAVLVPPGVPMHVISPGFSDRRMIICHFDPGHFEQLTGIGAGSPSVELEACIDIRDPVVLATLERLLVEIDRPALSRETIITGLGMVLLGDLTRHFAALREGKRRRTGTLAPWQIQRIDDRLSDETLPAPSVAELAELCGIGRRHLMRAFKASTGSTVMDHVERALFARAAELLRTTDMPVKSMAFMLGYERQASFSTAFRRRFGETPSAYRIRHHAGKDGTDTHSAVLHN